MFFLASHTITLFLLNQVEINLFTYTKLRLRILCEKEASSERRMQMLAIVQSAHRCCYSGWLDDSCVTTCSKLDHYFVLISLHVDGIWGQLTTVLLATLCSNFCTQIGSSFAKKNLFFIRSQEWKYFEPIHCLFPEKFKQLIFCSIVDIVQGQNELVFHRFVFYLRPAQVRLQSITITEQLVRSNNSTSLPNGKRRNFINVFQNFSFMSLVLITAFSYSRYC